MIKKIVVTVILFWCVNAYGVPLDQNAYHWQGQSQFFEGWYFKVSDPESGRSFLFIYAVQNPDGMSPYSQSFIMAGNNSPGVSEMVLQQFDVNDFSSRNDLFDARIGTENRISGDLEQLHCSGNITNGTDNCSWEIDFSVTERWDRTMGWMQYLPNLQTYWHVGAMQAVASGRITWNGEVFTFDDLIGYQEKNWGREFPENWYWLQANHFDDPQVCCLSIGGGTMPLGTTVFDACGIGLKYAGRLYTFSFPQNLVLINYEIEPGQWQIEARKGRYKIVIEASCDLDELINLMNPTVDGGLKPYTWETVTGDVTISLYEKRGLQWAEIVTATSDLAGLEFGGEQWLGWNQ